MLEDFKKKLAQEQELYLNLKVRPRAGSTKVKQVLADGTIKLDVAAEPIRGRANLEIIKFLAKEFSLGIKQITILAGAGESSKLVKLKKR